jgi:hypothetical protein
VAKEKDGGRIEVEDGLLSAGFVQLPILLARDPNLSAGAKLVYVALLWYHWRGQDYPGQQQLAEDFGFSERSARTYLHELEGEGYLESQRPGRGEPNTLILRTLRPAAGGENRPLLTAPSGHRAPQLTRVEEDLAQDADQGAKIKTGKICRSRPAIFASLERQNLPVHLEQQDSVLIRTESEVPAAADPPKAQPTSGGSDSDFEQTIRETATALGCPKDAKQLVTLAQAEGWPADLIRAAGRAVGETLGNGGGIRRPGAYLTTAIRVMVTDRRQAEEVGKRKVRDRREGALAYAQQVYADPIIGGNWRQVEAILRESYGAETAAWSVQQLTQS